MKKLITMVAVAAMAVVTFVGCTTTQQGHAAGKIAIEVYEQIEKKTDAEVVAKIQEIWAKVDAVQSFDELPGVWSDVTSELDDLIDTKIKNEDIAKIMKKLRKQLDKKIAKAIGKEVSKTAAQEFLIAFREEIRSAILSAAE